jgi:hypothetical protein
MASRPSDMATGMSSSATQLASSVHHAYVGFGLVGRASNTPCTGSEILWTNGI